MWYSIQGKHQSHANSALQLKLKPEKYVYGISIKLLSWPMGNRVFGIESMNKIIIARIKSDGKQVPNGMRLQRPIIIFEMQMEFHSNNYFV